jgi:hypothetical protein
MRHENAIECKTWEDTLPGSRPDLAIDFLEISKNLIVYSFFFSVFANSVQSSHVKAFKQISFFDVHKCNSILKCTLILYVETTHLHSRTIPFTVQFSFLGTRHEEGKPFLSKDCGVLL